MNANLTLPHKLGTYKDRTFWRFVVRLTQSSINVKHQLEFDIVAASAAEACNAIRGEVAPKLEYPAEFECAGPRGGITHRWVGWEAITAAKMFACRPHYTQLKLSL